MGRFGFSYMGLLYLLMLFIPNGIWAKNQPAGYQALAKNENKILLVFERLGQVCVTCCALIFSNYNPVGYSVWSIWLLLSFILMLLYEGYWLRYFTQGHTLKNFYGSFLGVPAPGAVLPVTAFLLLGIYGKVAFMILSVSILGIGHIGIHLQHIKTIKYKLESDSQSH